MVVYDWAPARGAVQTNYGESKHERIAQLCTEICILSSFCGEASDAAASELRAWRRLSLLVARFQVADAWASVEPLGAFWCTLWVAFTWYNGQLFASLFLVNEPVRHQMPCGSPHVVGPGPPICPFHIGYLWASSEKRGVSHTHLPRLLTWYD